MKKDVKSVVFGVLIALSLFVLAMSWLGLIFNFATAPDLVKMNNSGEGAYVKTVRFMQWSSLALFCILVPAMLCFVLSCFTSSKPLNIMAITLEAAVIVSCIVFMAVPSGYYYYGEDSIDAMTMTVVTGMWTELLQILIPSALLTGFAVAKLVKGGKAE